MYKFFLPPFDKLRGREGDSFSFRQAQGPSKFDYLSQYVKIFCNVITLQRDYPLQNDLKVVIAAGLTSSHPEQRS
jgi:hypothetical protein